MSIHHGSILDDSRLFSLAIFSAALGLFIGLTATIALAEDTPPTGNLRITPGLGEKQLREIIGEPDRRSSEQGKLQFWYYGKSMIVVEDGIIQGVSDRGELANRRAQYRPKQDLIKVREPEVGDDWLNPWTGPEATKARTLHQLLR